MGVAIKPMQDFSIRVTFAPMDAGFTSVAKGRESAAIAFRSNYTHHPHIMFIYIVFMLGSSACIHETVVATIEQEFWKFVSDTNNCLVKEHSGTEAPAWQIDVPRLGDSACKQQ
jgi:hypothetical protein